MNFKLIAVAGIGLLAGACSLRPLGTPGVYSSLPPEPAAAHEALKTSAAHAHAVPPVSGFGPVTLAPSTAMPGESTRATAERGGRGIDPVAALSASKHASERWATLRPGDLTRAPLLQSRLAAAIGAMAGGGSGDMQTGSVASGPAAVKEPKLATYDREKAMQYLIDGGRIASRKICDGC